MVDDEEIIRRGFSERVAWADYGFTFLEPCRNGTDAIAAVTALQPDVVLTDINMPGVNGLEVCAFVAENYPATTLVILSGYDEFEYAQKALSFKVFDYILKPVNVKKMGDLLIRLKDHLDTESSFRNSVELLSRQAEQSRELIRERLLNRLITEKPGSDDFQAYEKDIGVPLPSGCARAILIDPDDPDAIRSNPYISFSIFLLAVQNACLEAAPQGGDGTLIFHGDGSQTRDYVYVDDVVNALVAAATVEAGKGQVINVGSGTETSVRDLAKLLIEITNKKPEEVYNPRVSGGVSRMCADVTLAKQQLNYIPLISLEMGLRLTIERDSQFKNGVLSK